MANKHCIILGAPVQEGAGRLGCDMGPSALRAAGLARVLRALGCTVEERGNIIPAPAEPCRHPNPALKHLPEIIGWTHAITHAVAQAARAGMPITVGGDHALAAGTLPALAQHAAQQGRQFFMLWLDAHPDFHTLTSTETGHLHGVPVAYATGRPGFDGYFPPLPTPIAPENICMIGIRSVDEAERGPLAASGIMVHDMRAIDEHGIAKLLASFLHQVAAADGMLHVSLDVDFLDPAIAPGVGTTVPGGATFREAHLVMEMLYESGLVTSLDVVELNPFLDERGRTAILLVDLVASLMGRRVLDRPTQSYQRMGLT